MKCCRSKTRKVLAQRIAKLETQARAYPPLRKFKKGHPFHNLAELGATLDGLGHMIAGYLDNFEEARQEDGFEKGIEAVDDLVKKAHPLRQKLHALLNRGIPQAYKAGRS